MTHPFENFGAPGYEVPPSFPVAWASLPASAGKDAQGFPQREKSRYVDVVVPQSTGKQSAGFDVPVPAFGYDPRSHLDEAVVPEFKAPASRHPAAFPERKVQLTPPVPAVPDLDFLDVDDWTSPFDLDLDFDSVFDSWDETHLMFDPAVPLAPAASSAGHGLTAAMPPAVERSLAPAQPSSATSKETSETEEVDEFTRNRRACLERY